ncbi:MAG: hypothetical protein LBN21_02815 [Treponema sp.]|jgi:hypothetical protein|nr:hypothetical protein [Treponema sp.]
MKKITCIPVPPLIALAVLLCGCSTGEAIGQLLGQSSQAPVFMQCRAVSPTEISFQFSLPVTVVTINFDPAVPVESVDGGDLVTVKLAGGLGAGERITADILVEDENGNTLNVLVPLRTRNDRLPAFRINELRTEYSKPKAEFIEIKTLSAGNLGGLRLYIAGNVKQPLVYEFAPTEVRTGEYILIHLRTVEEGTVDETGSDLALSGGTDAVAGARDFWVHGTDKLLHKTDAVWFADQDDRIIDAVLLSETADPWWSKDQFIQAAELFCDQGAWVSSDGKIAGPADAVRSANIKTAMTRSISRDETVPDTNTASDWYITATSGITPGKPNNPARF